MTEIEKQDDGEEMGALGWMTVIAVCFSIIGTIGWWASVGAERSEYRYCLKELHGSTENPDYKIKLWCYENTF